MKVSYTTSFGIATISFSNPPHNGLPGQLLEELQSSIVHAGRDEKVRVIVLKSDGERAFCAGASFDELMSIRTREEGQRFFSGFAHVINACRTSPKLVIGRVQGKAVGGGVGLAAATDYCLASTHADIRLSELTIGIGPFVIEPAVSRKIGIAAFSELSINAAKFYPAEWAREKGLYAEVFDSTEALDQGVDQLTMKLASYNVAALSELKKVLWKDTGHWDRLLEERAAISGELIRSTPAREALERLRG